MTAPRVVVAGAGFGGIAVARGLARKSGADVQLIDRNNYSVFTPLLAEVATGTVNATDAVVPLREYLPSTRPIRAAVVGLDRDAKTISVRYADRSGDEISVPYDILVIALGSTTNFFGIDGLAEHALTLGNLADALALRRRVLGNLEHAEAEPDPQRRQAAVTFVIGGGSFTGVEVAGAITDYLRHATRLYPRLRHADCRVVLVEMKDRLLPGLPPEVGALAGDELRKRGVDVRLNTAIESLTAEEVTLAGGQTLGTRMALWAGGLQPNPIAGELALPTDDQGRLLVDGRLAVDGAPDIYACGDVAAIPDPHGGTYPPTAQHAHREGRYLADAISARIAGMDTAEPFSYDGAGMLVSLGQRRATGDVRGHVVSGLAGWLLWRGYYLSQLPSLPRKIRVALDWSLASFARPDLVELPP